MKYFLAACLPLLFACSPQPSLSDLQKRIDSLNVQLAKAYRPGFGEFMSNVQIHHAKLWFAGQAENWKLADFELHEIIETIEALEQQLAQRKETQLLIMLKPQLDSMNMDLQKKNVDIFKNRFIRLTAQCNECHRAVDFSFNVVKIPDTPPFSNQSFKAENEK
jgi:hypothetical protein